MPRVLIFQDKLGINQSYKSLWTKLILEHGLMTSGVKFFFAKSSEQFPVSQTLVFKGNRKTPGFNEDPSVQIRLLKWLWEQVDYVTADFLVLMDPALFFIVNNNWSQATTELLRGGVYTVKSLERRPLTALVMAPINSIHKGMKPKDIAMLNGGFSEKEEWEEYRANQEESDDIDGDSEDEDDGDRMQEFLFPITIPYGEFCFKRDLSKLAFLLAQSESK